jgi:hypothetical protein
MEDGWWILRVWKAEEQVGDVGEVGELAGWRFRFEVERRRGTIAGGSCRAIYFGAIEGMMRCGRIAMIAAVIIAVPRRLILAAGIGDVSAD